MERVTAVVWWIVAAGCGAPADAAPTRVEVWAVLPGVTATLGDASTVLDARGGSLAVDPPLDARGGTLVLTFAERREELALDWTRDYEALGLDAGEPLASVSVSVMRAADGACVGGSTNGRAAGHVWSGIYGTPVAPCGAFSFESFRLDARGLCADGEDCTRFVELRADGTLVVDRWGDPPAGTTHEMVVSAEDVAHAMSILAGADLLDLLGRDDRPCPPPMTRDFAESMTVRVAQATFANDTALCDVPALVAARAEVERLAAMVAP